MALAESGGNPLSDVPEIRPLRVNPKELDFRAKGGVSAVGFEIRRGDWVGIVVHQGFQLH